MSRSVPSNPVARFRHHSQWCFPVCDPCYFSRRGKTRIKKYLKSRLDRDELKLGEPIGWAKYVVDNAIVVFLKFAMALPLLSQWKYSSAKAISVARLIAVQSEDCGSCVQIEIKTAKMRKVEPEFIRYTLRKDFGRLGEPYQDVALFTEAVIGRTGNEIGIGQSLKGEIGENAFVEISIEISTARFYPTLKRALGFATECNIGNLKI